MLRGSERRAAQQEHAEDGEEQEAGCDRVLSQRIARERCDHGEADYQGDEAEPAGEERGVSCWEYLLSSASEAPPEPRQP
jgi:hypothetical protein